MIHSVQLHKTNNIVVATTTIVHDEHGFNFTTHVVMIFSDNRIITIHGEQNNIRLQRLITSLVERMTREYTYMYFTHNPMESSFVLVDNNDHAHVVISHTDNDGNHVLQPIDPGVGDDAYNIVTQMSDIMIVHELGTM